MIKKPQTYNNEATKENFKINWGKIKILTGVDIEKIKNIITNYDEPYNTIACVATSKILGRVMNANDNLNGVAGDRLKKEITDCAK